MSLDRPEEFLLDLHLGQADEDVRGWLDAELRRDAALRAKSERLGRVLMPLDHWSASSPAPNLADKVLSYIAARTDQRNVEEPRRGWLRFPAGRLREGLAIAASIGILVVLGVPLLSNMRERSRQVLCAANLEAILSGTSAYQQSYAGAIPFAGATAGASWLPVSNSGTPFASNSRHPYLLVKYGFVPAAKTFVCPSDDRGPYVESKARFAKDQEGSPAWDVRRNDDFPSAANISYDSLNLAGASPNLRPPPTVAYMADANPLFVGAKFNESVDADKANSPAHHGRGQTVLLMDGHVQFAKSPIYGTGQDNLWLIDGVRSYRGTEVPTRSDDAFLVPGCPQSSSH
ncbi:MAG: hypothetical protein HY287_16620 [Planctomycetes bacterium]|nr:hypothetical protein [Planctomycetota bacterium]MBI3835951.1 hypothetical protein [Planctomycetota bacterium]